MCRTRVGENMTANATAQSLKAAHRQFHSMQVVADGDIGPEAKGISCSTLTEGNEDRQGWAWAEPSLSFLRYLLSRTASVPPVLIFSAICSRSPVGRRFLRWTDRRSAHLTDSSCGEQVATTPLMILLTFVLPWRAKKGQHEPASSSLGALPRVPPDPFPMGSIATRARVAKLEYNYENKNQT
jgi:hypothetical protein